MNTPIQPGNNYPLDEFKNNDIIDHPEIENYINNVFDKENTYEFAQYQYENNLFSPFAHLNSTQEREQLCDIQPFALKRKLAYTDCIKDNRKDFSFVYADKKMKEK
jgi:hypothetical protein